MLPNISDFHEIDHTRHIGKNKSEKPPFKLCFPRNQLSGRSYVHASKNHTDFVTPKFYSREVEVELNYDVGETVEEMLEKENEKPQDIRQWPLLSSESYGWWYDRSFGMRDSRFDHHKNSSDLVRSNMVIHWQDKKLQGLCH